MIERPFLTIMTRCYKRPNMLLANLASAYGQIDKDFDHVIMVDEVGIGVPRANKLFWRNAYRIQGEYVLMLDDDDKFSDSLAIRKLKNAVNSSSNPGMVIFKCDHGAGLGVLPFPKIFELEMMPQPSGIGTCSYITRTDVFKATIDKFGKRLGGDYLFFKAAYGMCENIIFLDEQLTEVQRISNGKPE